MTNWPHGKKFAFTVFDDTDFSTVGNTSGVYDLLKNLGFRTTKSVWLFNGDRVPLAGGTTCEEPAYLKWIHRLQKEGFEIGFHQATYHSATREYTLRGLNEFKKNFGVYPRSMANHADCEQNIYWGPDRLTGWCQVLYNIMTRNQHKGIFKGHVKDSPLFWGDLCRQHVTYVRNFVYPDINTLKACPFMPYYDPLRPYVNRWYASANGGDLKDYVFTIREEAQDRLEAEGGACIMYTHFGKRFQQGRRPDPRFKALMERLARKNGWFVPVSTLLDYLVACRGGVHQISNAERAMMELRWLSWKIFKGPN